MNRYKVTYGGQQIRLGNIVDRIPNTQGLPTTIVAASRLAALHQLADGLEGYRTPNGLPTVITVEYVGIAAPITVEPTPGLEY